jgi:hypothetical protein
MNDRSNERIWRYWERSIGQGKNKGKEKNKKEVKGKGEENCILFSQDT